VSLTEVITHLALSAGWPRAALTVAKQAFDI
jgi:alkylhydroperoxidase/carboxymuconolactone decarboxylase family protein YurZ